MTFNANWLVCVFLHHYYYVYVTGCRKIAHFYKENLVCPLYCVQKLCALILWRIYCTVFLERDNMRFVKWNDSKHNSIYVYLYYKIVRLIISRFLELLLSNNEKHAADYNELKSYMFASYIDDNFSPVIN